MKQTITALAVYFLLCLLLNSCRTSKTVTQEQEGSQQATAELTQTSTADKSSSATFTQATTEQGAQAYDVIINFERWDFGDSAPTDSAGMIPGYYRPGSREPPNSRPTSVTKGTVTITGQGVQRRDTQTTAGAQVNETDSTATAATVASQEQHREKASEKKETGRHPGGFLLFLALLIGVACYFWLQRYTGRK